MKKSSKKPLWVHTVYFWLDRTLDSRQINRFRHALQSLEAIPSVRQIAVGKPAPSARPAVDVTYDFGLMTVFEGKDGHRVYQEHPLHKAFLEHYKVFWKKVVIYDFQTKSA